MLNLKNSLSAVLALNVFDAFATITWVKAGIAEEANPIMDVFISHSPALFLLVKMSMVLAGCLILWRNRNAKVTLSVGRALVFIYVALAAWHMQGFSALLNTGV